MPFTLRPVDPTTPAIDLIRQWLREHNWSANPDFMRQMQDPQHAAQPLILLAESDGAILGGLLAETQFSWLRISIMAVDPKYRSQGIGAALLAEAELLAKKRGCRHVYVDTMEHQAPRFYLTHGFQTAGQIPDWDSCGHTKFYFTKDLDVSPPPR